MNNRTYNVIKNLSDKKESWIPSKKLKDRLKKDSSRHEDINKKRELMRNKILGK